MQSILSYFSSLSAQQIKQFEALYDLYSDWNAKINVISRKDIQNLYVHHVLHSLSIAKFVKFTPQTKILDVGTGGGFPGIPLAVFFPDIQFVMIDSIGKKIRVVNEVAQALSLTNVEAIHQRVQDEKHKYDFVVSRAVMPLPELEKLITKNISPTNKNAIQNGLICLKGGDLKAELKPYKKKVEVYELTQYFSEPFFETKKLVYLPMG